MDNIVPSIVQGVIERHAGVTRQAEHVPNP
jgi:hypothetical protein